MPHAEQYFPVARQLIAADVATGIDLFLKVAGSYVLYRVGNQPVDAHALRKLRRLDVETLYVPRSQSDAFSAYVTRHAALLLQQTQGREQQIEILRDASHGALRQALARLDDPAVYEQVRSVAELTVDEITADVDLMSGLVKFVQANERLLTHTLNVTAYAVALGARHGLDARTLRSLGTGAMLHDVGMSAVDEELLSKSEPLSDTERDFIGRHPRRGREILEAASIDDPTVLDIVLRHHGRVGREPLSLPAQIVQLADVFDQLTSEVGERGPTGPFAAPYHMRFRGGGRYSADLLRNFVLLLGSVPVLDRNSPIAPLSRRLIKRVALAS